MNTDRQIRFLYPPILILSFIVWALFEDTAQWSKLLSQFSLSSEPLRNGFAALAAGSSVVLIVGFVWGTITFLLLRMVFTASLGSTHEVPASSDNRLKIWKAVIPNRTIEQREMLFATAYLHYGLCTEEVAEWIGRRWNAFNLSVNIGFGVAVVMALARFSGLIQSPSCWWYFCGACITALFSYNALIAWRDTMGMVCFCAEIECGKNALKGKPKEHPEPMAVTPAASVPVVPATTIGSSATLSKNMTRTKIAWAIFMLSIVCIAVVGCRSVVYYQEMAGIGDELRAGKLTEEAKRDRAAAAYIKAAGRDYLWHAGCFISICAALALGYSDTKKWWARTFYTLVAVAIFSLGAAFFLLADENVEFLEAATHAFLLGIIIRAKLASAIVSLIAGGLIFEMVSGLLSSNEKA